MNCFWMWNYGDYEIYHTNKTNCRREEFGLDHPIRWKLGAIEAYTKFYRIFTVEDRAYLKVYVNGTGRVKINNVVYWGNEKIELSAGKYEICIEAANLTGLPAVFVESDVCGSGKGWYTKDSQANPVPVGYSEYYHHPQQSPEEFFFSYKRMEPVSRKTISGGVLFDFGKELFGYVLISNVKPEDVLHISYGESVEEALDIADAIVQEDVRGAENYKLCQRAFRYLFLTGNEEVNVEADYEYLPLEYRGQFRCSDEEINRVWEMCAYTLHLNTREVFLDGIKRDRWCWSGDAYQEYKFSNYLFFDKDVIKRTILGLRGGDYVQQHINTITDYSLYWIISLWDYYMNFKDAEFIRFIYHRAEMLMDFVKSREDKDGLLVGKYEDWVFVDWADLDLAGAVCAEQMLYIEANKAMVKLAKLLGECYEPYENKVLQLTEQVNRLYWDEEKGAFIDSFSSGKRKVTRHANIFAILYDIANDTQKESIFRNVLLNDDIAKITTPYFEGYELDVMGKLGAYDYIENMLYSYWKGMLDLGATTVWEEFDPTMSGREHYAMYGKKYGKSLCHAWGAGPIYLLGRYYLGVYPTKAGFEEFEVKPQLGRFEFVEGTVPVLDGEVCVSLSKDKLEVTATRDGGVLIWKGERYPLEKNQTLRIKGEG